MAEFGEAENATQAMALNVAAWTDSSVRALGVETSWGAALWWRKPGGSPIYLSAILTDSQTPDRVLRADLRQVEAEWGTRLVSIWDCWAARDLRKLGFQRRWVEPWYFRPPSPLPNNFTMPSGLSIEPVTNAEQLGEFEEASWEGFEMTQAGLRVGRFGQHGMATLDDEGMGYLLARLAGRVVASAIAYATPDVLGLYGISTIPEFRRRGYATALVRAAVSLRPDLPMAVQPDPESVPMYTRAGFVPAGHVAAWDNGA